MFRRSIHAATLVAAVGILAACSSTPENPPPNLAAARVAIQDADPATVNRYAPLEMQEARSALERAEAAWRDENAAAAQSHAEQALASRRLAEARADAAQAQEATTDMRRGLDAGRDSLAPGGSGQPPSGPVGTDPMTLGPGTPPGSMPGTPPGTTTDLPPGTLPAPGGGIR